MISIFWFWRMQMKRLVEDVKIFFHQSFSFMFPLNSIELKNLNILQCIYLFHTSHKTRFLAALCDRNKTREIFLCRYKSHKEDENENCERLKSWNVLCFSFSLQAGWIFTPIREISKNDKIHLNENFFFFEKFFLFLRSLPNHKYKQQ